MTKMYNIMQAQRKWIEITISPSSIILEVEDANEKSSVIDLEHTKRGTASLLHIVN